MRTSFHHQPEAQHPKSSAIHKLPADYPIYVVAVERLRARDCLQARGETYGMARPSLPAR